MIPFLISETLCGGHPSSVYQGSSEPRQENLRPTTHNNMPGTMQCAEQTVYRRPARVRGLERQHNNVDAILVALYSRECDLVPSLPGPEIPERFVPQTLAS